VQVRNITAPKRARGGFSRHARPAWERRATRYSSPFASYDKPALCGIVLVEHGGGGSTAAAPIAPRRHAGKAILAKRPPLTPTPPPTVPHRRSNKSPARDPAPSGFQAGKPA